MQTWLPHPHAPRTQVAPAELAVLTIFVTSVCNARCETCFYWDSLNRPKGEMSLEEWARVAETVPPIRALQISGGEPTLDPELPDKVDLFVLRPETRIAMPTNGIKTRQVCDQVREISSRHPENHFVVGISIDGPGEIHDQIRGVPGNWDRCLETLKALDTMKKRHPSLRTTTLTTLMRKNIRQIPAMLRTFADRGLVDFVTVEPLRGKTPADGLEPPSVDDMVAVQEVVLDLNTRLLAERLPEEMPPVISHLTELYRAQRVVRTTGLLDLDCQAGAITGVLEANGTVRLCELLEPVGNVKERDYDWNAVWHSTGARDQREHILTRICSCTHCVNVGQSIALDGAAEARRRAAEARLEGLPAAAG